MKKICFVLTSEFAVKAFMCEHLVVLSQQFDVSLVVNTKNKYLMSDLELNVTLIPMSIKREIHLWLDFLCLLKLIGLFAIHRYDAVHSITPKAGLLTMLAGWITLRPMRVHTFQGEVWITKRGMIRKLLIAFDKLIASLATHLTIVSKSEKKILLENKIINPDKVIIFNEGSIAGVNLSKFYPDPHKRMLIRQSLNIPDNDLILLFIGRLNRDKGILDLVKAFSEVSTPKVHLLIVGPDEHHLLPEIAKILHHKKDVLHVLPETVYPADYMNSADVLCLPSYREGFGVVIIEAAACGIPSVASDIYGISDAIVEGKTGLLHIAGNPRDITKKLNIILSNADLREKLGEQALERARVIFDNRIITKSWLDFYMRNLSCA